MTAKVLSPFERPLSWLGRLSTRALLFGACCLITIEALCLIAVAAESHKIVQQGRAFKVATVSIAAGDTLDFSNEDEFIHQVYVQSPTLNYDSPEQSIGQVISIKFPTAGNFEVRCHIHPKMLLKVDVK
jgi:plastocyanin